EENVRRALIDLFVVLATKPEDRDADREDTLAAFPYVNGGRFDGEKIEIPRFTPAILDLLIHQASEQFDWSEISPTIFGAYLYPARENARISKAHTYDTYIICCRSAFPCTQFADMMAA
ncbi:MAG: hypothetical protein IJT01_06335, partial [Selenomonadaceae bacterium]|nr:hypothetical protein [Selenomonadaceae bacterium]